MRREILKAGSDEFKAVVRVLSDGFAESRSWVFPAQWRLSRSEGRIFRALLRTREGLTTADLMLELYPDGDGFDDPADGIIKVIMHRLRAKLKPFGIIIHTRRGTGYFLDQSTIAAIYARHH